MLLDDLHVILKNKLRYNDHVKMITDRRWAKYFFFTDNISNLTSYIKIIVYAKGLYRMTNASQYHEAVWGFPQKIRDLNPSLPNNQSLQITFTKEETEEVSDWLVDNFFRVLTLPSFIEDSKLVIDQPASGFFWTNKALDKFESNRS